MGQRIAIEAGTLLSCFSSDGHTLFVNGTPAPPPNTAPQGGTVLSIRLDTHPSAGRSPVHEVVSRLPTGTIPEGLAISPDGQLLVTVNLEHTYLPLGNPARGAMPRFRSLR